MNNLFNRRTTLTGCLCLLFAASAFAQAVNFTVAGNVTEASGEPLIGVTIRLDKTTSGTVTDIDGNYSFSGSGLPGRYTVIYSYVGYANERREFTVSNSGDQINLDGYPQRRCAEPGRSDCNRGFRRYEPPTTRERGLHPRFRSL